MTYQREWTSSERSCCWLRRPQTRRWAVEAAGLPLTHCCRILAPGTSSSRPQQLPVVEKIEKNRKKHVDANVSGTGHLFRFEACAVTPEGRVWKGSQ